MFENKKILIDTYNFETILAPKIETILTRGQYNARMKDYYDIYFFLTKLKNEIDMNIIKQAIHNTFENRESMESLRDYKQILEGISSYERINKYWKDYKNKYS